jgi:hypothetical protein
VENIAHSKQLIDNFDSQFLYCKKELFEKYKKNIEFLYNFQYTNFLNKKFLIEEIPIFPEKIFNPFIKKFIYYYYFFYLFYFLLNF